MVVRFEKVVVGFSRYHKYSLDTELRNKSREVVVISCASALMSLAANLG